MAGHKTDLSSALVSNEAVVDTDQRGGIHYLAIVNRELIFFNTHHLNVSCRVPTV